jgi:hypothetical protein
MPRKPSDNAAIDPLRGFPFVYNRCGPVLSAAADLWINSDIEPKFVACRKCWAFGPSAPTVTQATERWNKRATPPGTSTVAATSG